MRLFRGVVSQAISSFESWFGEKIMPILTFLTSRGIELPSNLVLPK
jgi:hypothetical protein